MYSSRYLVGDVTTIITHLRLRKVLFLIFTRCIVILYTYLMYCYVFFCQYLVCFDGTIIHTNVTFRKVFFCTVMYSCWYLVRDVTTIHTNVIFRKVFFWIFSGLMMDIWYALICSVFLWILTSCQWYIVSHPP